MSSILALDAGQSGIRSLYISPAGREENSFPGLRTDLELFPQLSNVISQLAPKLSGPVRLAVGMTGLTRSQSRPQQLLELIDPKITSVQLAHDSITGFLGSLGLNHGAVTAVGTGVVTLAVGANQLARVDGWGNLIGDAGSAYWIGRAGLEAGMKAYDGRIPPSKLTDLLVDNFADIEEAYIELQTNPDRVSVIASFARQVLELAHQDQAAREITMLAGEELALSALTAARRVGVLEQPEPRFSWTGNVIKADLLREAFIAAIIRAVPTAQVQEPIAEPIEGVALLPSLLEDSPIHKAIFAAERVSA